MAHRYLWGPNVPIPQRLPATRTDAPIQSSPLGASPPTPQRLPVSRAGGPLVDAIVPVPPILRTAVPPILQDPARGDERWPNWFEGLPPTLPADMYDDSSWLLDVFDPGHLASAVNWVSSELSGDDAPLLAPDHDYTVGPTLVARGFYSDSTDPDDVTEHTALRQGTVPGLPTYIPVLDGHDYPVTVPEIDWEVGRVRTYVSPDGSMTVNKTWPNHYFFDGTVENEMFIDDDGNVWVTSRGRGRNENLFRTWMNEIFGRGAFEGQHEKIGEILSEFQKHQR